MLEMDFTDTQLLLHANIKYCTRTLILQAFVLYTFSLRFCFFRIKQYISSISAVFWSLFLCKINRLWAQTSPDCEVTVNEIIILYRNGPGRQIINR